MENKQLTIQDRNIISLIRATAMFFIILCHFFINLPNGGMLGQLFSVGVQIFFCISGYLYGQKDITNPLKWYKKQFIKICVPLYIFYILGGLILLLLGKLGEVRILPTILLFLNLQGLLFGGLGNLCTAHLWFISYILLCYLITPLLGKLKSKLTPGKCGLFCVCLCVTEIIFILCCAPYSGLINIQGVCLYVMAYFFGAYWDMIITKRAYIILCVCTFLAVGLRLFMRYLSGTLGGFVTLFYHRVIVQYTHDVLAVFIIFTMVLLYKKFIKTNKNVKIINTFSNYSYYVYIVHYVFFAGRFNIFKLTGSITLNLILAMVFTVIGAIILKVISTAFLNLVKETKKL